MKVFALVVLLAVAACASAEENLESKPISELDELFAAELQENGGRRITRDLMNIPSCRLGPKIGNPLCSGKCISKGRRGGSCDGAKCTCVD